MDQLSDDALAGLLSFIGYGNPHARLRFMGVEEGLGGALLAGEQLHNVYARCDWSPIMDMHEAHMTLREQGRPIDISGPRRGSTTCWRFMARIARAVDGCDDFLDREKATTYVRTRLGRTGDATFLTELSPLPARRSSRPDLAVLNEAAKRGFEQLSVRRRRQLEILQSQPGITICFGLGKKDEFAAHLGIAWRMMADRFACSDDGLIFLTPYLGNGQMSGKLVTALVRSPEFQSALRRTATNRG